MTDELAEALTALALADDRMRVAEVQQLYAHVRADDLAQRYYTATHNERTRAATRVADLARKQQCAPQVGICE